MNDDDFRDACAMLRSVTGVSAEECFRFANEMVEARKADPEEEGIVSIKKRVRKAKE